MMLKLNTTDKGSVRLDCDVDLEYNIVRFTVAYSRPGIYERHVYNDLKRAHEQFDALCGEIG